MNSMNGKIDYELSLFRTINHFQKCDFTQQISEIVE